MKVYLAGPLFNEGQVAQRKLEGELLRQAFPNWEIFNPIDQPFNEKKDSLPSPIEIYEADTKAVEECDIFICDLSIEDVGVAAELAIAIYTKTKYIVGVNSDIRLSSANKYQTPSYGMNHYILGALLKYGVLVTSFNDGISYLQDILGGEAKV